MIAKPLYILIIIISLTFNCYGTSIIKNDSLTKKYRLFVCTYPSALLTGDYSIGAEFNYKRIRQEAAFFYKTFSVLDNFKLDDYKFNKGFRFNYYLKFNIINKQKHLLSFDIGYSYREREYVNKSSFPPVFIYMTRSGGSLSTYNINKKENLQGISIGFSNIIKLHKHLNFGFNLNYDLVKVKSAYQLNYYVSGGKILDPITEQELQLPYTKTYTKTWQELPNFLIKIIYEIK